MSTVKWLESKIIRETQRAEYAEGRVRALLLELDTKDAALRRAKAEVWQPFETAPREWNEILIVYTKCQPRVYELVYFNTVHKYWMCKGEPRLTLERSDCYWMPISNFADARAGRGGEVMGKLYVNDRKLDELILAAKFVLEGLDNLGLGNMRTTLRLKVAIEALSKGGDGE